VERWLRFASNIGIIEQMGTLTVKNLDDETAQRLAEKASQAGLSTQEYVRRLLDRDAATISPAELVERQSAALVDALDHEQYEALMLRVASMHHRTAENLGSLVQRAG
jgi:plasmid stability protein